MPKRIDRRPRTTAAAPPLPSGLAAAADAAVARWDRTPTTWAPIARQFVEEQGDTPEAHAALTEAFQRERRRRLLSPT